MPSDADLKSQRISKTYSVDITKATNVIGEALSEVGSCKKTDTYNQPVKTDSASAECGLAKAFASSSDQTTIIGRTLSGQLLASANISIPVGTKGRVRASSSVKVVVTARGLSQGLVIETSLNLAEMTQLAGDNSLVNSFVALDETTEEVIASGTLLNVQSNYQGTIGWNENSLDLTGLESGIFSLSLNEELASIPGSLLVEYENGTAKRLEETGVFTGCLPSDGTCNNLNSAVGGDGEVKLSFNLPSFAENVTVLETFQLSTRVLQIIQ